MRPGASGRNGDGIVRQPFTAQANKSTQGEVVSEVPPVSPPEFEYVNIFHYVSYALIDIL